MRAERMLIVECPDWAVAGDAGDAGAFEPVVAAVESFTPRVEVLRPGTCAFATRGPSRYFGGEDALAAQVAERVDGVRGGPGASLSDSTPCGVGVADGRFAAELAARRSVRVPPGGSATFLAPFPVSTLPSAELADLFRRLGIQTLGQLAALPAAAVLARFGVEGRDAHRLARGLDDIPLTARVPPPDLTVVAQLDPPAERVETAAFAAKSMADELCGLLARRGLVVTCVRVEAEAEDGEHRARLWRHDAGLTATSLGQRVRWQLEGWCDAEPAGGEGTGTAPGGAGAPPRRGGRAGGVPARGEGMAISLLRLVPEEVCPDDGRQLGFWGGRRAGDEGASRVLARVQGMLGHESVVTGVVQGGRGPGEQIRLIPWGDPIPPRPPGERSERPWPGLIPPPGPATVHAQPPAADVVDATGTPVTVTGRGQASAEPSLLRVAGGAWVAIESWAGPWSVDERWWDAAAHSRRARCQLVTVDGSAHLLRVEHGRWWVEATYD